ncbi:alcohol dehydrogenase catalytic domain-containing protein [Streptomyces liangshanensis]|uniref:alcohol dehydrogenase catalytic domain-containing protein n=1 Tax=Streptomyces liangshanensis TaxID=2717324 RepID=UPI0036DF7389
MALTGRTRNRTVLVSEPGGTFTVTETPVREPGPGEVRVAVEACGICHSDVSVIDGQLPGTAFPLTPGHEIAGRVEALGDGVTGVRKGQRVACGYIAGTCGRCEACRSGDSVNCVEARTPGVSCPGGFADTVVLPESALSLVPDGLASADAAALACAGLSAFNALRNSAARPGDLVAVQGLGGVGHLAVRIAARMGFETVAVARGREKARLAVDLGADHYIDSTEQDVARTLTEYGGGYGGAKVVVSTVTDAAATTSALGGLGRRGELVLVGISPEDLRISGWELIGGTKKVYGLISGTTLDREEMFRFAVRTGIRPWTERLPLEEVGAAYARMLAGEARFRMVLTTGH